MAACLGANWSRQERLLFGLSFSKCGMQKAIKFIQILCVLQTELSSITHFMAAVRPKLLQHERLYPAESLILKTVFVLSTVDVTQITSQLRIVEVNFE